MSVIIYYHCYTSSSIYNNQDTLASPRALPNHKHRLLLRVMSSVLENVPTLCALA